MRSNLKKAEPESEKNVLSSILPDLSVRVAESVSRIKILHFTIKINRFCRVCRARVTKLYFLIKKSIFRFSVFCCPIIDCTNFYSSNFNQWKLMLFLKNWNHYGITWHRESKNWDLRSHSFPHSTTISLPSTSHHHLSSPFLFWPGQAQNWCDQCEPVM